jgi:hypothetical protein
MASNHQFLSRNCLLHPLRVSLHNLVHPEVIPTMLETPLDQAVPKGRDNERLPVILSGLLLANQGEALNLKESYLDSINEGSGTVISLIATHTTPSQH